MSKSISLDRVRILRNAILREWQNAGRWLENEDDEKTRHGFDLYRKGLMKALWDLYNEFDEVEQLPLDVKPRCFVCGEEMEQSRLAAHMGKHLKDGDLRGIKAPCLWPDSPPHFWSDMGIPSAGPARGAAIPLHGDEEFLVRFVEDPPPVEVIIHGVKYKREEES